MATRLPLYLMRDGVTRLGQTYFNPVWADLDSRLDTLERIKIDWNAQVAQLRELGLVRIDEYIRPLTDEVDALLAQAKEETDGLAQQLVDEHITPLVTQANQLLQQAQDDTDGLAQQLVDEHIAPLLTQAQQLLGEIQGIKQAASDDADAIAQALADMNWEQQLEDLETSVNQALNDHGQSPIGTPDWPVTLDYNAEGNLSGAVYAQGTDRYRQSLTYNSSGNLATVLYEQSNNSGTTYTEIGIETLHYDAEGNITHTEWTGV